MPVPDAAGGMGLACAREQGDNVDDGQKGHVYPPGYKVRHASDKAAMITPRASPPSLQKSAGHRTTAGSVPVALVNERPVGGTLDQQVAKAADGGGTFLDNVPTFSECFSSGAQKFPPGHAGDGDTVYIGDHILRRDPITKACDTQAQASRQPDSKSGSGRPHQPTDPRTGQPTDRRMIETCHQASRQTETVAATCCMWGGVRCAVRGALPQRNVRSGATSGSRVTLVNAPPKPPTEKGATAGNGAAAGMSSQQRKLRGQSTANCAQKRLHSGRA